MCRLSKKARLRLDVDPRAGALRLCQAPAAQVEEQPDQPEVRLWRIEQPL